METRNIVGIYRNLARRMTRWVDKKLNAPGFLAERRHVRLYTRHEGPVAYAVTRFLSEPQIVEKLPGELSASGIAWFWTSELRCAGLDTNQTSFTKITKETALRFIGDVLERDEDGYGRTIVLIGANKELDTSTYSGELALFCKEAGPVEMVLFQPGDSVEDYIFVKHEMSEPVRSILAVWGVVPLPTIDQYPYAKLRTVQIEQWKLWGRLGRW
jgi:hypothetical protein